MQTRSECDPSNPYLASTFNTETIALSFSRDCLGREPKLHEFDTWSARVPPNGTLLSILSLTRAATPSSCCTYFLGQSRLLCGGSFDSYHALQYEQPGAARCASVTICASILFLYQHPVSECLHHRSRSSLHLLHLSVKIGCGAVFKQNS